MGPSGDLLNRIISRSLDRSTGVKLEREDFFLFNVVPYRPPNNELTDAWYEGVALAHYRDHLLEVIETLKPRAIVALGNQAFRALTGFWGLDKSRGYIYEGPGGIPVVPTYHPSFLLRGKMSWAWVVSRDIEKAVSVANGGWKPTPVSYTLDPALSEAQAFFRAYLEDPNAYTLAFDIETPYSESLDEDEREEEVQAKEDPSYQIIRISFAFEEGKAISFPWVGAYADLGREVLRSCVRGVVWNESFDVPRLEANNAPVSGEIIDAMIAFHFWHPSLRYNLAFASSLLTTLPPWKHLSNTDPAFYSAVDSDALLKCYNKTRSMLEASRRWEGFQKYVVDLGPVLKRMSKRGVLVHPERREKARVSFGEKMEEVAKRLQALVPRDLKPKKIFKISKERLEKKFGPVEEGPSWCVIEDGTPEPPPKPPKPPKEKKPRKPRKKKELPNELELPSS